MAAVWLDRHEAEKGDLPDVCMRCGRPADARVTRTMKHYPAWAYLVGGVILASILAKSMKLKAPVCDRHRRMWVWPLVALGVGVGGGLALIVVGGLLTPPNGTSPAGTAALLLGVAALLAGLVGLVVFSLRQVRSGKITADEMQVQGVSPGFVRALKAYRRGEWEPDGDEYDAGHDPDDDRRFHGRRPGDG